MNKNRLLSSFGLYAIAVAILAVGIFGILTWKDYQDKRTERTKTCIEESQKNTNKALEELAKVKFTPDQLNQVMMLALQNTHNCIY